MKQIVDKARAGGIQVFYVPHHRSEPGDFKKWKHATAAFTHEMLRAAHEFNGPTYASEILTTEELLAAM